MMVSQGFVMRTVGVFTLNLTINYVLQLFVAIFLFYFIKMPLCGTSSFVANSLCANLPHSKAKHFLYYTQSVIIFLRNRQMKTISPRGFSSAKPLCTSKQKMVVYASGLGSVVNHPCFVIYCLCFVLVGCWRGTNTFKNIF